MRGSIIIPLFASCGILTLAEYKVKLLLQNAAGILNYFKESIFDIRQFNSEYIYLSSIVLCYFHSKENLVYGK